MGLFSKLVSSKPAPGANLPPLQVYSTLSEKVEAFVPLSNKTVKMYNCGPTVYDEQHIGNLRGPILSNLLRRTLEAWGYTVHHVSNITDVGHLTGDNSGDADTGIDRMEASAQKKGKTAQEIAHEITELFYADLDRVGIDRNKITFTPATHYIGQQIALIEALEEKGYTYTISDGVYFNTKKFPEYGKLGHINLGGQEAGARVEENKEKKNPYDFALWKFSPKDEKRQQEWPSPWGVGFPGWHIECTAMIFTLLGKQIDIHIGGIDLVPIHHNNEIAQAEAVTARQFAKYWMHNAFITIESKKVSKSLGNTIYLHQITDRGFSAQALRYWYLTGHYRSPMNFTWDAIEGANTALIKLTRFYFEELPKSEAKYSDEITDKSSARPLTSDSLRSSSATGLAADSSFLEDFTAAMANDLDTPKALARVWELVKDDTVPPAAKRASLIIADNILGLGFTEARASAKLAVIEQSDLPDDIQKLVSAREAARTNKDFTRADELRHEIETLGYELKDSPEGVVVTKK